MRKTHTTPQMQIPSQPTGDRPRFYSVPQVAEILGMSPVTLYRAINAGEFPGVRIRGRVIVPARAVDDLARQALGELPVDADMTASGGAL